MCESGGDIYPGELRDLNKKLKDAIEESQASHTIPEMQSGGADSEPIYLDHNILEYEEHIGPEVVAGFKTTTLPKIYLMADFLAHIGIDVFGNTLPEITIGVAEGLSVLHFERGYSMQAITIAISEWIRNANTEESKQKLSGFFSSLSPSDIAASVETGVTSGLLRNLLDRVGYKPDTTIGKCTMTFDRGRLGINEVVADSFEEAEAAAILFKLGVWEPVEGETYHVRNGSSRAEVDFIVSVNDPETGLPMIVAIEYHPLRNGEKREDVIRRKRPAIARREDITDLYLCTSHRELTELLVRLGFNEASVEQKRGEFYEQIDLPSEHMAPPPEQVLANMPNHAHPLRRKARGIHITAPEPPEAVPAAAEQGEGGGDDAIDPYLLSLLEGSLRIAEEREKMIKEATVTSLVGIPFIREHNGDHYTVSVKVSQRILPDGKIETVIISEGGVSAEEIATVLRSKGHQLTTEAIQRSLDRGIAVGGVQVIDGVPLHLGPASGEFDPTIFDDLFRMSQGEYISSISTAVAMQRAEEQRERRAHQAQLFPQLIRDFLGAAVTFPGAVIDRTWQETFGDSLREQERERIKKQIEEVDALSQGHRFPTLLQKLFGNKRTTDHIEARLKKLENQSRRLRDQARRRSYSQQKKDAAAETHGGVEHRLDHLDDILTQDPSIVNAMLRSMIDMISGRSLEEVPQHLQGHAGMLNSVMQRLNEAIHTSNMFELAMSIHQARKVSREMGRVAQAAESYYHARSQFEQLLTRNGYMSELRQELDGFETAVAAGADPMGLLRDKQAEMEDMIQRGNQAAWLEDQIRKRGVTGNSLQDIMDDYHNAAAEGTPGTYGGVAQAILEEVQESIDERDAELALEEYLRRKNLIDSEWESDVRHRYSDLLGQGVSPRDALAQTLSHTDQEVRDAHAYAEAERLRQMEDQKTKEREVAYADAARRAQERQDEQDDARRAREEQSKRKEEKKKKKRDTTCGQGGQSSDTGGEHPAGHGSSARPDGESQEGPYSGGSLGWYDPDNGGTRLPGSIGRRDEPKNSGPLGDERIIEPGAQQTEFHGVNCSETNTIPMGARGGREQRRHPVTSDLGSSSAPDFEELAYLIYKQEITNGRSHTEANAIALAVFEDAMKRYLNRVYQNNT